MPMAQPVSKQCPECKAPFSVSASKAHKYLFCGLDCRKTAAQRNRLRWNCEKCGKPCSRAPSQTPGRFCSYECSNTSKRVTKPCEFCGEDFTVPNWLSVQRFCSISHGVIWRLEQEIPPGYLANKIASGYRTDIEARAEAVLIELEVDYVFEKKIGRYSVDFAIPEMGIAIECDGWRHANTTEKDVQRDHYLLERGWKVVRISGTALVKDARSSVAEAIGLKS